VPADKKIELEAHLDKAMANRHAHKKLRLAARARMATTGETYQTARARILQLHQPAGRPPATPRATDSSVDLLSIRYFGVPAALATFEIAGRLAVLVVSSAHRSAPFPQNPVVALGPPRVVH
jgi:hypothetical protein